MKNTTYTFDQAPNIPPITPQIPGLSQLGIDYNRIINRP